MNNIEQERLIETLEILNKEPKKPLSVVDIFLTAGRFEQQQEEAHKTTLTVTPYIRSALEVAEEFGFVSSEIIERKTGRIEPHYKITGSGQQYLTDISLQ